jgi:hypothetical protein
MCCLRCAGAPRRPASGSGLLLSIPSRHAVLSDPGEFVHPYVPDRDVDIGLYRVLTSSALPKLPQIRFTRAVDFVASMVRTLLRPASLLAPLHGSDWIAPAIGDVYFWASSRSVALPASRYNYNSDWTPLLSGLAPDGMAASLAAPTLATGRPATALPGPVSHRLDCTSFRWRLREVGLVKSMG